MSMKPCWFSQCIMACKAEMVAALISTFVTGSVLSGTKVLGTISVLGLLLRLCVSLSGVPSEAALFMHWDPFNCCYKKWGIFGYKSPDKSCQFAPFGMASPIVSGPLYISKRSCALVLGFFGSSCWKLKAVSGGFNAEICACESGTACAQLQRSYARAEVDPKLMNEWVSEWNLYAWRRPWRAQVKQTRLCRKKERGKEKKMLARKTHICPHMSTKWKKHGCKCWPMDVGGGWVFKILYNSQPTSFHRLRIISQFS